VYWQSRPFGGKFEFFETANLARWNAAEQAVISLRDMTVSVGSQLRGGIRDHVPAPAVSMSSMWPSASSASSARQFMPSFGTRDAGSFAGQQHISTAHETLGSIVRLDISHGGYLSGSSGGLHVPNIVPSTGRLGGPLSSRVQHSTETDFQKIISMFKKHRLRPFLWLGR
jgi:hypothetical protein